jgi:hypothetical protein
MSDALSRAIQLAMTLPEKDQEALGSLLLREMESDQKWSALFAKSQNHLSKLADKALADHRAGRTTPWNG